MAAEMKPEVSEQLAEEIAALPPDLRMALRHMWTEITAYAVLNARRLDGANELLVTANRAIDKMQKWLFGAFVALAVLLLAAGVATVLLAQAHANDATAARHNLVIAIQTSRFDGAYRSCQNFNARHVNAERQLRSRLPASQHLAIQAARSLIDVAVPYRSDCAKYAATQTALNVPPLAPVPRPTHHPLR